MSSSLWIRNLFSFRDLLFTKDGIVVIRPVSLTLFAIITGGIIIILGILFGFLSVGIVFLSILISGLIRELIAISARQRLSVMKVDELNKRGKIRKRIEWLAVERMEYKRGNLILWKSGGKKDMEWMIGANMPLAIQFIRSNTNIPLKVFKMRWNLLLVSGLLIICSLIFVTLFPPLTFAVSLPGGGTLTLFPFLTAGFSMVVISIGLLFYFLAKPKAIHIR